MGWELNKWSHPRRQESCLCGGFSVLKGWWRLIHLTMVFKNQTFWNAHHILWECDMINQNRAEHFCNKPYEISKKKKTIIGFYSANMMKSSILVDNNIKKSISPVLTLIDIHQWCQLEVT